MPADTNPHGDIFGGWLLCQMDLAGATIATRHAGGRVVTIAITAMVFHRPVCVGDEVSCYASVTKTGNTSITIKIESWARRARGTDTIPIKVERKASSPMSGSTPPDRRKPGGVAMVES